MEWTELRNLLVEIQTATQTSIQQLTDSVGTMAANLATLNTTLTARFDPKNQPVALAQPLPQHQPQPHNQLQQNNPPQHQHHLPPQQHQHQPLRRHQQRQQHHQQFGDARARDIYEEEDHRRVYRDDLRHRDIMDNRWENSFKVDIPEFHEGLKGDDLIDWLVSVEEILDFKQVPPNLWVSLVAMPFRGHAATWWKQLKTTHSRTGKSPIQSWDKLTKHLRQTFLPHNYERTIYTKLQNLRQGSRTVDEYAKEFSLLLTRNKINDSQI